MKSCLLVTVSVLLSCSSVDLQQVLFLLTSHFVWRTAPQTLSGSCGVSFSPPWPLGAAPQVPACKRKFGNISKSHTGTCVSEALAHDLMYGTSNIGAMPLVNLDHCCYVRPLLVVCSDLRGGSMQVGQPHVCRVLRGGEFVHGWNKTVSLLVHVVQEAEHAEVRPDAHSELCLCVSIVLRTILLLLPGVYKRSNDEQRGETVWVCCRIETRGVQDPAWELWRVSQQWL